MSGHSKWSTIKHQKAANDQARGKLFSKLARGITLAVKAGGGSDPDTNYKLRVAIDQAKSENMPKANIERAISSASKDADSLEEIVYEGYGPDGIGVIVEALTDNRNRTAQVMKSLFERGGGRLAGPGSVSFNFVPKGFILVKKQENIDEQMLAIIDAGAEEMEETENGIEVYTEPSMLYEIKEALAGSGQEVLATELIKKPKQAHFVSDEKTSEKAVKLLEQLDEHEDTQKVFTDLELN